MNIVFHHFLFDNNSRPQLDIKSDRVLTMLKTAVFRYDECNQLDAIFLLFILHTIYKLHILVPVSLIINSHLPILESQVTFTFGLPTNGNPLLKFSVYTKNLMNYSWHTFSIHCIGSQSSVLSAGLNYKLSNIYVICHTYGENLISSQ